MVRGEKKIRTTTNLDFPSVLLNQGLTEANNNFEGRKLPLPFFTNKEEKRREKREKKREETDSYNIAESSTRRRLFARQHIPPQNNFCENAHYTQQEKQREYIKTRSQTTRSSPHRKRTNTDLSLNEQNKERRRKSISKSREKEVLRAKARFGFGRSNRQN